MIKTSLIPWLDPQSIIGPGMGIWAVVIVCSIVFAETGLLVGFLLPGDTLLFFAGLLTFTGVVTLTGNPGVDVWLVSLAIGVAAFLGGEVGYLIGHKAGPAIFERKESGLFSTTNVQRTNRFFERFGALAIILARFVPIVRTFAPVAAGVAHMNYRKYSLYNLTGALIWGVGVTMAGFLLAHIPWVKDFAEKYIDLVLLGVVVVTVIPTAFHYWHSSHRARKASRERATVAVAESTEV